MNPRNWALLLLLSVLWGGAYFFAGVAVAELPPLTVVLARVLLASITLLPLFWYMGYSLPRRWADWYPFLGMGILNNVIPFAFIFAGQLHITVGLSSIINAMTPLFTVLVMASFKEERLTAYRLIGVLLGVLGVAVLRGFGDLGNAGQTLGIALCLVAALSYGFAGLWGRKFLLDIPPVKSATCQLLCSTCVMAVLVSCVDQPWTLPLPSKMVIFSLLGLAVFGTALAYIVFFNILSNAGASNVMLVTLLIPVSAMLLGNVFLSEPIRGVDIIGASIIGSGLMFIDGRLIKWLKGAVSRPRQQ